MYVCNIQAKYITYIDKCQFIKYKLNHVRIKTKKTMASSWQ